MSERKLVEAEGFSECDSMPLVQAIASLQEALSNIPEQYQASAVLVISGMDDSGMIRVKFTRPETDEELAVREAKDAKYLLEWEAGQRALFESLKLKFEAK